MFTKAQFCSIAIVLMVAFVAPEQAKAGYLFLDPDVKTVKPGTDFDVTIKVNTEGDAIITTDAQVDFDPALLTVVNVTKLPEADAFLPQMIQKIYSNRVYVGSYIYPPPKGVAKEGTGSIAIIRFKGKKEGSATIALRCVAGQTRDSNMTVKRNGKVADAIDCTKVKGSLITLGSPAPTATPTPTSTPTPTVTPTLTPTATPAPTVASTTAPVATSTPTPSVLPETGIIQTTRLILVVGIGLTVISYFIKLYVS